MTTDGPAYPWATGCVPRHPAIARNGSPSRDRPFGLLHVASAVMCQETSQPSSHHVESVPAWRFTEG